jgi:hypothetical protein
MWRRVDVVLTDVSEEGIASVFRVEGKNNMRKLAPALTVSSLVDFLIFSFYPEDGGHTFLRNVD